MNLFLVPMWMLSGSLFAMNEAHGLIRAIMRANPLTYSVSAIRRLMMPGIQDGSPALATSVAVTALFGAVLLALSAALASRKESSSNA
jgi:ABC-2 type transport system permease protein